MRGRHSSATASLSSEKIRWNACKVRQVPSRASAAPATRLQWAARAARAHASNAARRVAHGRSSAISLEPHPRAQATTTGIVSTTKRGATERDAHSQEIAKRGTFIPPILVLFLKTPATSLSMSQNASEISFLPDRTLLFFGVYGQHRSEISLLVDRIC